MRSEIEIAKILKKRCRETSSLHRFDTLLRKPGSSTEACSCNDYRAFLFHDEAKIEVEEKGVPKSLLTGRPFISSGR